MSVVPPQQYSYTDEESLELLIHSIRGNKQCQAERKAFNLCRSTVLGKFVEPEFCKDKSINFLNCFQQVRRDETQGCKDTFTQVLNCGKQNTGSFFGGNCQSQLNAYLNCQ
ncbi:hypothetical protein PPERSA_07606 [Pseudocohnilembus persalinus]|uniref:Uncharacterized protein n=1 Tax=Pseudocohnilembus persalinus TaxID=266149 RepID=A0A0V0QIB6_PSEPJ|nr:hypothetical protein PPERSA_07606 [Pseudocohnilembus persalinus]|eukprot:KRX01961.1 hypothetical protein PPERSA_07606 [Pseudocohnilembus persalinus]